MLKYEPAGHEQLKTDALPAGDQEPEGQSEQLAAPVTFLYLPALQLLQTEELVAPVSIEYLPVTQDQGFGSRCWGGVRV